MEVIQTDTRPYDAGPQTMKSKLTGQLGVLIGLAVLALVAMAFASLATWSVEDPSFSNANGTTAQNMMGGAGAAFADLMMQFFGLSAAIALIAPSIWGWMKLMQKEIGMFRVRIMAWIGGLLVSTAAMGALAVPQSWPLPTGLGGVSGDLILRVPQLLFSGLPTGFFAFALFGVLALPAVAMTLFASGMVGKSRNAAAMEYDPETGEIFDDEDEPSWFMGLVAHWYFTIKTWFARRRRLKSQNEFAGVSAGDRVSVEDVPAKRSLLSRTKAAFAALLEPEDDGLEYADADRAEPDFHEGSRQRVQTSEFEPDYASSGLEPPTYGEEVHSGGSYDFDPGFENDPDHHHDAEQPFAAAPADAQNRFEQPAGPQAASPRVKPMAPKPRESSRVVRDAQPSLISDGSFELPTLHFLSEPKNNVVDSSLSEEALEQNARLLEGVLEDFGVKGEIINVRPGPVVTMYELEPAPGIKSSRVIGLADDIARSMSAIAARVAVVPGRNAIGIELPNQKRETVYLREMLASENYDKSKAKLPLILGKTIGGEPTIADLAKMPHLLVAGTTGSGKSVAINTMILSILYRMNPEQVKMIMIDPKMLELSIYDGIPHLLTPVVTDPKKAVVALKWTVREMEERYKKMSKMGVRNIDGYNTRLEQARKKGEHLTRTVQTGFDRETGEAIYETEDLDLDAMPYIVVIIDEMADLMMVAGKDIEGAIQRLAQMARAAGIHVIMATQRPSVDVITGTIKANFPTRISFQVTSKIDSRTILGEQGAEQLLGMGDMLYMAGGGRIQRVHGPFVADEEVESVVNHLKTQGVPQYLESVTEDEDEEGGAEVGGDAGGLGESNDIYDQAVAVVLRDRKVSTSYIQRRLSIGYNRAASLIERMEQEGLIGAANHAGKREILVPGEDETI